MDLGAHMMITQGPPRHDRPKLELAAAAERVSSTFLNQYRSIPVQLG